MLFGSVALDGATEAPCKVLESTHADMTTDKTNLLDLSYEQLVALVVDLGQPRFRATQIWRWIYNTLTDDPNEMINLPKALRQYLIEKTYVGRLRVITIVKARDGLTEKVLFEAADRQRFETVLMRYTQSGFVRDLTTGEITAQVLYYARQLREENALVTNIVLMGMGEPLLNYDNTWRAIVNLNDREGLALGARRFTVSTAGVVPGIEKMAREPLAVGLAVSLHAPNDALRDQLVPMNRRYPLEDLLQACKTYIRHRGRRVTFEYALAKGLNDSDEHAQQTADLLQGLLCHVNLIPLNPTPGCDYEPSTRERVLRFQEILVKGRIQTTVRLRRGIDIQAGCGQLRGTYLV